MLNLHKITTITPILRRKSWILHLGMSFVFGNIVFAQEPIESSGFAPNKMEKTSNSKKILHESIGGVIGGTVGLALGAASAYFITDALSGEESEGFLSPEWSMALGIGAPIGYLLGSSFGIWRVGNKENKTKGSFWKTMVGSVAGATLLGILPALVIGSMGNGWTAPTPQILVSLGGLGVLAGGIIGYNMQ